MEKRNVLPDKGLTKESSAVIPKDVKFDLPKDKPTN